MNKFIDNRADIKSPSYRGKCPIAALRGCGHRAWIEIDRGPDGRGAPVDVLMTTAPQSLVAVCAGHGLAFDPAS